MGISTKQRERSNEKAAQYWRVIEENKWGGSYGLREGEMRDGDEDEKEADEPPAAKRRGRPAAARAQDTNDVWEPFKKRARSTSHGPKLTRSRVVDQFCTLDI